MGLLQLLFNAPPTPGAPFLLDRDGRKYWFAWHNEDVRPSLSLSFHGRVVAHVYTEWCPNGLVIVDIVIDKPGFKRRGLGTVMLKQVVDFAKSKGAKSITGLISKQDADDDPHLLDWYRRRGFTVRAAQEPRWGGEILLDLAAEQESRAAQKTFGNEKVRTG